MERVVLLTGGNLGDVAYTLEKARSMISARVGHELMHSSVMGSEPWGFAAEEKFLNQVLVLETELDAFEVLSRIQRIEAELGRERAEGGNFDSDMGKACDSGRGICEEGSYDGALGSISASGVSGNDNSAEKYASRPIDIDILFYGDKIIDTPLLKVPHPLMGQRLFVLEPLAEIMPGFVHPVSGMSVARMLEELLTAGRG